MLNLIPDVWLFVGLGLFMVWMLGAGLLGQLK